MNIFLEEEMNIHIISNDFFFFFYIKLNLKLQNLDIIIFNAHNIESFKKKKFKF